MAIRHPHFELRGDELFFLRSRRPCLRLTGAEAAIWDSLESPSAGGGTGPGRETIEPGLERLIAVGAVVAVPVGVSSDTAPRAPVLVVEAHMDDAVLSAGGTMLSERERHAFEVVTLCGRSNFTSAWLTGHDLFDEREVTDLRAAESRLALRVVGGSHAALTEPEAPLRAALGAWSRAWYRDHRKLVDAQIGHAPSPVDVHLWAERLEAEWTARDPEEVWLPLGVGPHTDHETLRLAWLRLLRARPELLERTRVYLYRDVPYHVDFPDHERSILAELRRGGYALSPETTDLGPWLDSKCRLAAVYASQFKPDWVRPRLEAAALDPIPDLAPASGPRETRYRLTGSGGAARRAGIDGTSDPGAYSSDPSPPGPDPIGLYSEGTCVLARLPRVGAWIEAVRGAPRIRLLTVEPLARAREDLAALARLLECEVLEAHARADHLPDRLEDLPEGVSVLAVEGGRGGWAARLAALAVRGPTPTLVVSGRGLWAGRGLARMLGFGGAVLVTRTISEAVLAVRRISASNGRNTVIAADLYW